ncbi:MAG: transporter substrate-binding domain-containing protein, partial [Anaerolineae bacterium]
SRGYIGANPDKLKLIGDPLAGEDFGFIFTPKSDLRTPFDQAIGSMKQDGFLDHLSNRWFFLFDASAK